MDGTLVTSLFDTEIDAGLLGGKGAGLARLVRLGHRVPPGFVMTTEAFDVVLEHLGVTAQYHELRRAVASGELDDIAGSNIIDALLLGELPKRLASEITSEAARCEVWESGRGRLIVRSSATVEDSADFSFAGIFESIEIQSPQELESAILRVLSSAFSKRALTYASDSGVEGPPRMAVVIQSFLDATRSGVMFTSFHEGRALVEHVEGGCEKLVKGEVIPARFWTDRSTGDTEGEVDLLSPRHVSRLGELAIELELQFGGPQDVEWCIYDGEVHLVQTRPITASWISPEPSEAPDGAILSGVSASHGVGVGAVHLAFNIEHALAIETGQVLVTPMTNPDMVVAMRSASAIVTDVGGMICHAAIVSRELGLPCVVGTRTATETLASGTVVTVDGSNGAVYAGRVKIVVADPDHDIVGWGVVWERWRQRASGKAPIVSTVSALADAPRGLERVLLRPEIDLRVDEKGLWRDLERMDQSALHVVVDDYVVRIRRAAETADVQQLEVLTDRMGVEIASAFSASAGSDMRLVDSAVDAVPLGEALTDGSVENDDRQALPSVEEAREAAHDTIKFFGHEPAIRTGPMPAVERRRAWWSVLPAYGRFHAEYDTYAHTGSHRWLEVRPELVISAMLKSLVQPGFEMVPRVLGFAGMAPLHIKWMNCRYYFRSDAFDDVWSAIVDSTWDPGFMADLMHRVRDSYDHLAEVLALFPNTEEGFGELDNAEIIALITSWWPRWVEFFALCWFIQAQGDDVLYPFIEETLSANQDAIADMPDGMRPPATVDIVAPTTSVLSAEYMHSVSGVRDSLIRHSLVDVEQALEAVAVGTVPSVSAAVSKHLAEWHWMRDRDLLFEPWDTPRRVIKTALRTGEHTPTDYQGNLGRNVVALALHSDLAERSGRAQALNHAVRFFHDLNVERENHHLLWLKYSYPLRQLILESGKRLAATGDIQKEDVWFLQAPELIDALRRLPTPVESALWETVKNRRRGFEAEARLSSDSGEAVEPEDDYL